MLTPDIRFLARAFLPMVAVIALTGCGGGGDESLMLTVNADFVTDQALAALGGTASLPSGSAREGGTLAVSVVTCSLGAHEITWANPSSHATGDAVVFWDCDSDVARWSALRVPLSEGENRITVTYRDNSRTTQAVVTVTRRPGAARRGPVAVP